MNEIAHECIFITFCIIVTLHTTLLFIDRYDIVRCFACFRWGNEEYVVKRSWILGQLMHFVQFLLRPFFQIIFIDSFHIESDTNLQWIHLCLGIVLQIHFLYPNRAEPIEIQNAVLLDWRKNQDVTGPGYTNIQ